MASTEHDNRLVDFVPGAAMLLLLGAGAVGTVSAEGFGDRPDALLHDGSWTTAWEASVDASVRFRDLGVSTWAVLEWVAFGDGRTGVVPGRDGWLFSDEEYQTGPQDAAETRRKIELVAEVDRYLDAHGTQLVVALLPAKTRLHPEQLVHVPPATLAGRYASTRDALEELGVPVPDLLTVLEHARSDGEVFLRTDTHWTPRGADAVAAAIALTVRPLGLEGLGASTFETTDQPVVEHHGDLLNFLPLGPFQHLGPPADSVVPRATTRTSAPPAGGLFDEVSIPVAVVGTSYTQGEMWNFPGALQQHLGAEVLDASLEGQGPLVPMKAYLENEAFLEAPPSLVVWEIPERFLRTPYDEAAYSMGS